MDTYDIKKAYPSLYAPKAGDFHVVDVPELLFLMIDGHGDPNTTPTYGQAVEALYTLSYAVRAVAKTELWRPHTVGPLEGLWSADDPATFVSHQKDAWNWTLMIAQPTWVDIGMVERSRENAERKGLPGLERLRLESFTEGASVQVLHVGSYDDEAPVLAKLHDEYLPTLGLAFNGAHHEIYLSDPRRTEPAKLRTILRQPVVPLTPKEDLFARVRTALGTDKAVREVRMFGGLCFMVNEKMVLGVMGDRDLLVRADPDRSDDLLAVEGARQAEMGKEHRSMGRSWISVSEHGLGSNDDLQFWVDEALSYNVRVTGS